MNPANPSERPPHKVFKICIFITCYRRLPETHFMELLSRGHVFDSLSVVNVMSQTLQMVFKPGARRRMPQPHYYHQSIPDLAPPCGKRLLPCRPPHSEEENGGHDNLKVCLSDLPSALAVHSLPQCSLGKYTKP